MYSPKTIYFDFKIEKEIVIDIYHKKQVITGYLKVTHTFVLE